MTGGPVIAVAGAGSIGCFVGGMLAHSGREVSFLGRPRIMETVQAHGLRLTDMDGFDATLATDALFFSDKPEILSDAHIILVCVKSGATKEMAELIREHGPEDAVIVSLQNGVTNADVLRGVLPDRDIRAGMVPYNVVNAGEGRFHRGVSGHIVIEAGPGAIAAALSTPQLETVESNDIRAVQWGKLLINLNNALNALSDMPLRDEIMDRGWRALLADQIEEAMGALQKEGVEPRSATPLPTKWLPLIMRLPTPVYKTIAARNLRIDPEARSSMWEDLRQGRKTEIDELQGAVVALCDKHGLAAPINKRVAALIRDCEDKGAGPPGLTPQEIRAGT